MIIDFIKVHSEHIESPCGTEIVFSAVCDCGCEYQHAIVVSGNEPTKAIVRAHEEALRTMKRWLATDRHGSQLRPSPQTSLSAVL